MKQFESPKLILVVKIIVMILVGGESMKVLERSPDLSLITANVIKSCYGESANEIGLAGNLSDSFTASITSGDSIAAVLLNGNKRSEHSGAVSKWSRRKLQLFAITATSSMELESLLLDLKNSRWWNHMAQFYISGTSGKETGCSEAFGFLWTAWKMDILGAKFICNDDADGALIYSFNPYTEDAPSPWTLKQTHRVANEHPWALFVRKYNEKINICENIDFDSTRDLGGYEFRVTMARSELLLNATKTGLIVRNTFGNTMMNTISRYLKVTPKMVACGNEPLGFVDKNGSGHGRVGYLTDGRSDLLFRGVPLDAVPELPGLYPFISQRTFSVTQYTAYLTQWEKVLSAIDHPSRIALCIVILVNILCLKYLLRQSFMISILNTVRLISNSCFTKLPNNLTSRIYLAGLFCFVIVIQALFQGQLSALLAKQIRLPNINNNRDLVNSDYVVYGWYKHKEFFSDPAFDGRFVGIDILNHNCTDHLLLNSSIACVSTRDDLIDPAVKLKLHMSKQPVLEIPVALLIRKDWPLEERVNRHQSHYLESGILNYEYEATYVAQQRTLDINENEGNDEKFKILTPSDLNFAFFILGIGLGCATLSFLVECYVGKRRLLKTKIR